MLLGQISIALPLLLHQRWPERSIGWKDPHLESPAFTAGPRGHGGAKSRVSMVYAGWRWVLDVGRRKEGGARSTKHERRRQLRERSGLLPPSVTRSLSDGIGHSIHGIRDCAHNDSGTGRCVQGHFGMESSCIDDSCWSRTTRVSRWKQTSSIDKLCCFVVRRVINCSCSILRPSNKSKIT